MLISFGLWVVDRLRFWVTKGQVLPRPAYPKSLKLLILLGLVWDS